MYTYKRYAYKKEFYLFTKQAQQNWAKYNYSS